MSLENPEQNDNDQDKELTEGLERDKVSRRKFQEFGHLGVLAQDHWNIGGSPPMLLNENPEKTLGELLSDEELLKWLDKLLEYGERAKEKLEAKPDDEWAKGDLEDFNKQFPAAIKYLASIGRLPEKYKSYQE
jgi:hypothetical protein